MSAKDQDQSMEEILQSIKRIIAEEGDPAPSGSDVLELTDMVTAAAPEPAPVEEPAPAAVEESASIEMSIDEIMAMPSEPAAIAPAPIAAEPVVEAPTMEFNNDGLVSNVAVETAAAAIKTLIETPGAAEHVYKPMPSPALRSGVTVEDLVVEALRPMLKEWLDANLPQMVERLVDREIKRIVALTKNV